MTRKEWLDHLRNLDKIEVEKEIRDEIDKFIDEELKEQGQETMARAGVDIELELEPEPYGPVTHSNKNSKHFKKVEEKLAQQTDIDPECEHYENAMGSLNLAEKYGLQVEVFCTAMDYFRKNKLTISEAFLAAQWDWDVCVPLSEQDK